MKGILLTLFGGCLLFLSGCAANCPMCRPSIGGEGEMMAQRQGRMQQQRHDVLYTCNCGAGCTCNTVKTSPGTCRCGAPLKWGHILKIEGNEALLCQCDEGCTCALNPQDQSKCSCGKPVKRVNLKGTGIYFCNCGGACMCNTVSDQPGKCRCGMELKKID
ncbi:MAG: hypothetical protein WC001_04205 [Desulfurivibrionaceae bacterium]